MKKIILMCCLLFSVSLAGCGVASSSPEDISNQDYILTGGRLFVRITYDDGYLLIDRATKVQYFTYGFTDTRSMSVLLDADGKPILYEGELK